MAKGKDKRSSPKVGGHHHNHHHNRPISMPGSRFVTQERFMNRSDKNIGTWIHYIDSMAKQAIDISKKTCPGAREQLDGLRMLDNAANMYIHWLEDAGKNNSHFQTVNRSLDDVLYYRGVLLAEVQNCINNKVYGDLNNAFLLQKITDDNKAGVSVGGSADDEAIREKIRRCKVNFGCDEVPTFEGYAGGLGYKRFFEDYMTAPFELKNYGSEIKGTLGTMLFGPPGTGKTYLAKAVAGELYPRGSSCYSITASAIKGKYVGESEKSLTMLFEEARKDTDGGKKPVIIFIDEAEGLLDKKDGESGAGTGLLAQLNVEMEGLSNASNKGLIVIIATNFPDKIPSAAVARFIHKIYVGLPNEDDVREILVKLLVNLGPARWNLEPDIDVDASTKNGYRMVHYNTIKKEGKVAGHIVDWLDVLSTALANSRYAPREVEQLFKYMAGMTYGQSRDFYRDLIPEGGKPESGKTYVTRQWWILDKTTFRHKIKDPLTGACSAPVTESKHALIPIGFPDEQRADGWQLEGFTPINQFYGSLGVKSESGSGKNVKVIYSKTAPKKDQDKDKWLVETYRELVKDDVDDPDTSGTWKFYIVKKEDKKTGFLAPLVPGDDTEGEEIENINTILGAIQITPDHFEEAMNNIKPTPIDNARKLLAYALSPGRTIEKKHAKTHDLNELAKMAEDEQHRDMAGVTMSNSDLGELLNEVERRKKGEKTFDFSRFYKGKGQGADLTAA